MIKIYDFCGVIIKNNTRVIGRTCDYIVSNVITDDASKKDMYENLGFTSENYSDDLPNIDYYYISLREGLNEKQLLKYMFKKRLFESLPDIKDKMISEPPAICLKFKEDGLYLNKLFISFHMSIEEIRKLLIEYILIISPKHQ